MLHPRSGGRKQGGAQPEAQAIHWDSGWINGPLVHCTLRFPDFRSPRLSVPGVENGKLAPFLALSIARIHSMSGDLLCVQKNSEDQRKACKQQPESEWNM